MAHKSLRTISLGDLQSLLETDCDRATERATAFNCKQGLGWLFCQ